MKHLSRLGVLLLSSILIIGCGGGGSTPTPGPTPVPSPSPTPTIQHFAGKFRAPKGVSAASTTVSAEGTFVSSGTTVAMSTPRTRHQAVELLDGRVLLIGGSSDNTGFAALATIDIFDPVTETISPSAATMSIPRADFGATLLPDGKVFIIGGSNTSSFDLYDPATDTIQVGSLPHQIKMGGIKAYNVPNGKGFIEVLLLGGTDATGVFNNPVPLDLTTNGELTPQFLPLGATALSGLTINQGDLNFDQSALIVLQNGHLLITGGNLSSSASSSSIFDYDPSNNTLTKIGNLSTPRHGHSMLQLADGTVHVYGGVQNPGVTRLTDVESLNLSSTPVTGVHIGNLAAPRAATRAVLLQNGTSVHVGGVDLSGVALNTQMLYVDGQDTGGLTGDMVTPRINHTLTSLPTGLVLVAGGSDPNGVVTNTLEIFDPQTSIYLQFASEQVVAGGTLTFKLVDAAGNDISAGTTFTADKGSFSGTVWTAPTTPGLAVITATNGSNTAKVTITVTQ